jgi:hypothetical protein
VGWTVPERVPRVTVLEEVGGAWVLLGLFVGGEVAEVLGFVHGIGMVKSIRSDCFRIRLGEWQIGGSGETTSGSV